MSTEVITQVLGAGQTMYTGQGLMFLLSAASSPVSIIARTLGSSNKNRKFTNVPAGFKFTCDTPDDGFTSLEITSAAPQTISIAVGDDDVSFSNNVTVTGTVTTVASPFAAATDTAEVVTAAGQAALCAANGGRRSIKFCVDPLTAGAGVVYLRKSGGGHDLMAMQPGVAYEFPSVGAFDYNDPVGANRILILEQT